MMSAINIIRIGIIICLYDLQIIPILIFFFIISNIYLWYNVQISLL